MRVIEGFLTIEITTESTRSTWTAAGLHRHDVDGGLEDVEAVDEDGDVVAMARLRLLGAHQDLNFLLYVLELCGIGTSGSSGNRVKASSSRAR